jgi:hypothetical protein
VTAAAEPFDIDHVDARLRGRRLLPRFGLAFVLGLLAVLAVGVGALYAYDRHYQDRVLPSAHVGGIDLSGLTATEAAARLHETYHASRTSRAARPTARTTRGSPASRSSAGRPRPTSRTDERG